MTSTVDVAIVTPIHKAEEAWTMRYTGDKYMHCARCGKKQKFVRCTRCNGKVSSWTNCRRCKDTGYVCSAAPNDDFHLR